MVALPVRAQQPQPEQPKKPDTAEQKPEAPPSEQESPVYKEQVVVTASKPSRRS